MSEESYYNREGGNKAPPVPTQDECPVDPLQGDSEESAVSGVRRVRNRQRWFVLLHTDEEHHFVQDSPIELRIPKGICGVHGPYVHRRDAETGVQKLLESASGVMATLVQCVGPYRLVPRGSSLKIG